MALTKLNLDQMYTEVSSKINSVEESVVSQLATLQTGGEMTQAELLKLQYNIARYTVSAAAYSALVKEISDGLKQTANKIG